MWPYFGEGGWNSPMRNETFGQALKELLEELNLGKSPSAWYAEKTGADKRSLEKSFRGVTLMGEKNWAQLVQALRRNFSSMPGLDERLRQLKQLLVRDREAKRWNIPVDKMHGNRVQALETSDPEDDSRSILSAPTGHERTYRLTEYDPEEDAESRKLWDTLTSTSLHQALQDKEWAWASEWFPSGKAVSNFPLRYQNSRRRYDKLLDPIACAALDDWCARTPSSKQLRKEPWGSQVRLVGAAFNHSNYRNEIDLSPTKFLYYAGIHQNLWRREYRGLRLHSFRNALTGIDSGTNLILPSTFSVHMAVVSSDGKALLRRRRAGTPIYPLAWEAGIGEFMHGPIRIKYPHFTDSGKPSLPKFLRHTVQEELNYSGARSQDFRIYGIAAEYRTLAPKLIVVYTSDIPIKELMRGARESRDAALNVRTVDLSIDGITQLFRDARYPTWGPTSKLVLLLALMQHSKGEEPKEVVRRVKMRMHQR